MKEEFAAQEILKAVDADRFLRSIDQLAQFGWREDGGVEREAFSEQEIRARFHLVDRAHSLGCHVEMDPCGNLFFIRAGTGRLPPVVAGSHIDTQPIGGRLDGAFGVLAGMEVLAAMNDAELETTRPVAVAVWSNEEGSRFKPGAMGSSAFVEPGLLDQYRLALGTDGVEFGQALDRARSSTEGASACEPRFAMHAYLEAHIEQGPVLDQNGSSLAVVTGIQGMRWFEVRCQGCAAHAGTTPMEMRRDAVVLANRFLARILAVCAQAASDDLRITCGQWQVSPNSINTIASEVIFTLDVRSELSARLDWLEQLMEAERKQIDDQNAITIKRVLYKDPVSFDGDIQARLEKACLAASGHRPIEIMSSAFHDAINLVDHCPTGMIFVPSIGGVSHNAAEATKADDLVLGARALAFALVFLAV